MSAGCPRKTTSRPTRHSLQNAADSGSAAVPSCYMDGIIKSQDEMSGEQQQKGLQWRGRDMLPKKSNALSSPCLATVTACTQAARRQSPPLPQLPARLRPQMAMPRPGKARLGEATDSTPCGCNMKRMEKQAPGQRADGGCEAEPG